MKRYINCKALRIHNMSKRKDILEKARTIYQSAKTEYEFSIIVAKVFQTMFNYFAIFDIENDSNHQEILRMYLNPNKLTLEEIADAAFITMGTLKNYVKRYIILFNKLFIATVKNFDCCELSNDID